MRKASHTAVVVAVALVASGCTMLSWGGNFNGQLGDGTTSASSLPVVAGDNLWTAVSGGAAHTCAIAGQGSMSCWGRNDFGQVGDGSTVERSAPTPTGTATNWATVDSGGHHACATRADGTLWCWGWNAFGNLGDGTKTNRTSPTQIGADTDWASIGSSFASTCAIKADGTLWCWGHNFNGQLGDGTGEDKLVPTQIGSDANWATITGGTFHACATRTDGTAWCWGDNEFGQLGDGSAGPAGAKFVPTQIGTATDWSALDAGQSHTCGIRTDDTLWCWGRNSEGQLGLGDTSNGNLTPTQVGSGVDWVVVSLGDGHTCGLRSAAGPGNDAHCWGENGLGQVGDGTTTQRNSPTEVGAGTEWFLITTGGYHSSAVALPD